MLSMPFFIILLYNKVKEDCKTLFLERRTGQQILAKIKQVGDH